MKTVNRVIAKKGEEFFVLEEIKNTWKVAKEIRNNNQELYRIYRIEPYVYKNASTNEFVNIADYQGCEFVNTRNIVSVEFFESEFFEKNRKDIISTIYNILYKKGPSNYKYPLRMNFYDTLNTSEFLCSDFAKDHYSEIFNILNNIVSAKETKKESKNKLTKVKKR